MLNFFSSSPSPFATGFVHFLSAVNCCDSKEKLQAPSSQPIEKTKGKNPLDSCWPPGNSRNGDPPCCILITSLGNSKEPQTLIQQRQKQQHHLTGHLSCFFLFQNPQFQPYGFLFYPFFFLSVSISCGHGKDITLHL